MQCIAGIELFKYLPTNSRGSNVAGSSSSSGAVPSIGVQATQPGSSNSALGEVCVEVKALELADLRPNAMMQAVLQGTRLDVGVFWEKYERTCRAWLDNRQPAWVRTAAAAPPPMRRMIEVVRQAAKQAAVLPKCEGQQVQGQRIWGATLGRTRGLEAQ